MVNKVFEPLSKVLCLINNGRGGNNLAETERGVKNEDMKFNFELNTQYSVECNGIIDKYTNNIVNDDDKEDAEFTTEDI